MSLIQLGYGSEWHMLRFLGRHRKYLTDRVLEETGGSSLTWCDFDFSAGISAQQNYGDSELKGLNFLPVENPICDKWCEWWPQTGNVPNWDAVGVHRVHGVDEWLLVEAKGNVEELFQTTTAKPRSAGGGLEDIQARLAETQQAAGVLHERVWTTPYYQYANRLAVLHFLNKTGLPARLLFIYFTGDSTPNRKCPASVAEWAVPLEKMKLHLGLTGNSPLEAKVHRLFLSVLPQNLP